MHARVRMPIAGAAPQMPTSPIFAHTPPTPPHTPTPTPHPPHPPATLPQIQSVHVNPVDHNLVMSAGNDYTARILDIRNLTTGKLAWGEAVSTAAQTPVDATAGRLGSQRMPNHICMQQMQKNPPRGGTAIGARILDATTSPCTHRRACRRQQGQGSSWRRPRGRPR